MTPTTSSGTAAKRSGMWENERKSINPCTGLSD
jgi:hypothetical protein